MSSSPVHREKQRGNFLPRVAREDVDHVVAVGTRIAYHNFSLLQLRDKVDFYTSAEWNLCDAKGSTGVLAPFAKDLAK